MARGIPFDAVDVTGYTQYKTPKKKKKSSRRKAWFYSLTKEQQQEYSAEKEAERIIASMDAEFRQDVSR